MNKRLVPIFLISLICVAGCASLQKAAQEVTPAQQANMTATITPAITAATAAIPAPYSMPVGTVLPYVLGWLACVGYNFAKDWWKAKTVPPATPPAV